VQETPAHEAQYCKLTNHDEPEPREVHLAVYQNCLDVAPQKEMVAVIACMYVYMYSRYLGPPSTHENDGYPHPSI